MKWVVFDKIIELQN